MNKRSAFVAIGLWAAAQASAFAQQPPLKVTAWGQHHGGNVLYRYQVQNIGTLPLRRFSIGLFAPDGRAGGGELSIAPRGGASTSLWLPEQSATRPFGWGVSLDYPDESERFSLEWIEGAFLKQLFPLSPMIENAPAPQRSDQSLPPGSVTTVSVVVEKVDLGYVNGHVTVDTAHSFVSVPIVRGDTTPPTIQLTAARLNQNEGRGEWAMFRIKVDVSDNFDPNPEVAVEPVTANSAMSASDVVWAKNNAAWDVRFRNVPNRSYTFSVKATDASGNEAVRSFVYEVGR